MITKETLAAIPFFSDIPERELELIVPLCRLQEGQEGDYLIHEGVQVSSIYFLLSGKVGVYKKDKEVWWYRIQGEGDDKWKKGHPPGWFETGRTPPNQR